MNETFGLSRKSAIYLLGASSILLVVLGLLRAVQGIDFSDVGFFASTFKFFFSDTESIKYGLVSWFTNFVGALVWKITGGGGLLSLNLAGFLLYLVLCFFSCYVWLKYRFKRELIFLVSLSFAMNIPYVFTINYNLLSLFLLGLATLLLLMTELSQWRRSLIFFVGILFAFSVGARLPNICFGIAVLYLYRGNFKDFFKDCIYLAIGLVIGCFIQFGLMVYLKQFDLFLESLSALLNKAGDPNSTHGVGRLLKEYWRDLFRNYKEVIVIVILFFLFRKIASLPKVAKLYDRRSGKVFAFILFWYVLADVTRDAQASRLNLFFTFSLLIYFLIFVRSRMAYALLVFPLSIAAGSNSGFFQARAALSIVTPFLVVMSYQYLEDKRKLTFFVKQFLGALMLVVFVGSIKAVWHGTYRDSDEPFKMTAQTEVPRLKGMFTTSERATVINELYQAVDKLPAGSSVIAYSEMPLLYFVSDIRSPVFSTWPDLYEHGKFMSVFESALAKGLPIFIFNKFTLRVQSWPTGKEEIVYVRENDKNYFFLQNFVKEKRYKLSWENSYFEIWTPPQGAAIL